MHSALICKLFVSSTRLIFISEKRFPLRTISCFSCILSVLSLIFFFPKRFIVSFPQSFLTVFLKLEFYPAFPLWFSFLSPVATPFKEFDIEATVVNCVSLGQCSSIKFVCCHLLSDGFQFPFSFAEVDWRLHF